MSFASNIAAQARIEKGKVKIPRKKALKADRTFRCPKPDPKRRVLRLER